MPKINDRRCQAMPEPKYVSTGEAAKALGVSERSLRQWAIDGVLVPDMVTPGGHRRWDVERLRFELRAGVRRRAADEDE